MAERPESSHISPERNNHNHRPAMTGHAPKIVSKKKMIKPRILVVTPEITYLPTGMGNMAQQMNAKAGGLADVSASLVSALFELGADVHVALPNYRQMFHTDVYAVLNRELSVMRKKLPEERIHLAEDRLFYYRDTVYSSYGGENPKISVAFQREVINRIIQQVKPDLIHCNDWMTGIVPAAAREFGIRCLFTVHNIHTEKLTLDDIESTGLDARPFSNHFYYTKMPTGYDSDRYHNQVDCLATGIFASHYINTVSPSFLEEIIRGQHRFVPHSVAHELWHKREAGCASGIINAPDPSYHPATDEALPVNYTAENHIEGKLAARRKFRERTGLKQVDGAPILFWPSRLDPIQKGPQLLAQIMYQLVSDSWKDNLQIAIVANGVFQSAFHDIVRHHDFYGRVAVCNFDEDLSRLGYAASDFIMMPSSFEPCGLPQMIAPIYGSLSIVHNTGGLKDTVEHLNVEAGTGNGFAFENFDAGGFRWAIDEAMRFFKRPEEVKNAQIKRVMTESLARFNHSECARQYFEIYEAMLNRPLFNNPVAS